MEWYEAAFDRLYPVLYGHRNLDEAVRVADAFAGIFEGKQPLIDVGSGSGRYMEAFSRQGMQVFGLDLSHYLLRTSVEEWGQGGRVVQGDMRRIPFHDGSFGGALNMFTSFGYFSVDTDNLLVFKEVHRVLRAGGIFLFDYINAERISKELLESSERESLGYRISERRRFEEQGKYLVKEAELRRTEDGHKERIEERLRLYTKNELLIMFKSIGFHVRDIYGDYSKNPFVDGVSERVVIVSEKAD
jgi:SAM-dependent methyltransferase